VLAGKEYGTGSVARLGGQRHAAAGGARRDCRDLRAHTSQQTGGNGRAAAGVSAGADGGIAGPRRARKLHGRGSRNAYGRVRSYSCGPARTAARKKIFEAVARVDTPEEGAYYRNGGILPYVLRQDAVMLRAGCHGLLEVARPSGITKQECGSISNCWKRERVNRGPSHAQGIASTRR